MSASPSVRAVTFDFGQTLADLDTELLAARLAERAVLADAARLEAAGPAAWHAYSRAIQAGAGGHPWKLLMRELLGGAGVEPAAIAPAVDWLWTEQPTRNLWRRPVPGMIALVDALAAAGLAVAVVSNSEGRLAELAAELGWERKFAVIADSGKLGLEKPDPRIFAWTCERLGVAAAETIHVGDAWAADIEGARAAGLSAVWFRGEGAPSDPRVRVAADAPATRRALRSLGAPLDPA